MSALGLYFIESKNCEDEKGDQDRRTERSFHTYLVYRALQALANYLTQTDQDCPIRAAKSRFGV